MYGSTFIDGFEEGDFAVFEHSGHVFELFFWFWAPYGFFFVYGTWQHE